MLVLMLPSDYSLFSFFVASYLISCLFAECADELAG